MLVLTSPLSSGFSLCSKNMDSPISAVKLGSLCGYSMGFDEHKINQHPQQLLIYFIGSGQSNLISRTNGGLPSLVGGRYSHVCNPASSTNTADRDIS